MTRVPVDTLTRNDLANRLPPRMLVFGHTLASGRVELPAAAGRLSADGEHTSVVSMALTRRFAPH
jgi:hypothetical protein